MSCASVSRVAPGAKFDPRRVIPKGIQRLIAAAASSIPWTNSSIKPEGLSSEGLSAQDHPRSNSCSASRNPNTSISLKAETASPGQEARQEGDTLKKQEAESSFRNNNQGRGGMNFLVATSRGVVWYLSMGQLPWALATVYYGVLGQLPYVNAILFDSASFSFSVFNLGFWGFIVGLMAFSASFVRWFTNVESYLFKRVTRPSSEGESIIKITEDNTEEVSTTGHTSALAETDEGSQHVTAGNKDSIEKAQSSEPELQGQHIVLPKLDVLVEGVLKKEDVWAGRVLATPSSLPSQTDLTTFKCYLRSSGRDLCFLVPLYLGSISSSVAGSFSSFSYMPGGIFFVGLGALAFHHALSFLFARKLVSKKG